MLQCGLRYRTSRIGKSKRAQRASQRNWKMKITPTTCDGAPIVLIYGGEGRGKTTLACKFPKPVAMLLERGLPRGVSVDAIDGLGSYDNVVEALRELYRDPRGYQ